MTHKRGLPFCPQCGASAVQAAYSGRSSCGGCGQELIFCYSCGAANLAWSNFCHNCAKPVGKPPPLPSVAAQPVSSKLETMLPDSTLFQPLKQLVQESLPKAETKTLEIPAIERMRLCPSCMKAIGEGERFCSYCGAKQAPVHAEPQATLDPLTMKVAVTMLARITEAKDRPEYRLIDELTTKDFAKLVLKEKPYDARELSFLDQLKLLALVFEYARDYVKYKGEAFGEHIRWAWETMETGGDCDCKVVLLATMLKSLAFPRMYLLVLPPGSYLDTNEGKEKKVKGHVMLEVELSDKARLIRVTLDPSCPDCDVDETPESVEPFLQNFYRIPIDP